MRRPILPIALGLLAAILILLPPPVRAGSLSAERLDRIDTAVKEAIDRKELLGAVVVIVHKDRVAFRRAYGNRSLEPKTVSMTADTLFDLASLTKPIATATSIMILVEQGKLRLTDPVGDYLPAFKENGKDKITIEQLLLHTSGLPPVTAEGDFRDSRDAALQRIYKLKPKTEPGAEFRYSDIGFIVLGELVAKVSGLPLDEFARKHIFAPLGLKDTGFRPKEWKTGVVERAAPTERREDRWMIGEVHDPRAYLLGGVAGHAGLFSTADDLAVLAQMFLQGGEYRGQRIFSPLTVRRMTTPRALPGGGFRAAGWDVQTSFSANKGELFPRNEGFGHTGFTGTSIWIDPGSELAVIFLSNRVHPNGKGNVNRLRGQVATLAAAALEPGSRKIVPVQTGIDVLVAEKFKRLQGRKVGLVTNHTGQNRDGKSTIDLLHHAEGVKLIALFSPEHGIRGALDAKVDDSKDKKTGLPIYSLYGPRRKPTAEILEGIDTLVFDIQDAGCRFYTYISTMGDILEAGAKHKIKVVVLDRPNPLGGLVVDGPILDEGRESFVAYHTIPVRHGMTVGELAGMFNKERKIGADLEVVRMAGWRRGLLFAQTGLTWLNPSPNMRSLTQALLYPGVGLLETTNLSVGRGTDRPFEWIGAPWLDGQKLAVALAEQELPGVRFVPLRLTPTSSVFKDQECGGVQLIVDDWAAFQPLMTGLALACQLRKLYPDAWKIDNYDRLLGNRQTFEGVKNGQAWPELCKSWRDDLARYQERRKPFLLYQE